MSSTTSHSSYHNRPGESLGDILSLPIVLLFLGGGLCAALALVTAAESAYGWATLAGIGAAVGLFGSFAVTYVEHEKLRRRSENPFRPPWATR
ncbi:hypothetical protein [Nocardia stercoris]|uniref:hypothetical protein n=1 Tax=Nocardia stercoris TaxID=2483361 RepID=UPI0011C3F3B6|nr:hypothetical protein [Nocardia stercoris]